MTTVTRTYTVQFRGRRLAHAEWIDGSPRINVSGDMLHVGYLDLVGRWREYRLQPGEELVVERVSRRRYTLGILLPDDDGGSVTYTSHTRPRPRRMRGSRWYRVRLTDMIFGRRHIAYVRNGNMVIG